MHRFTNKIEFYITNVCNLTCENCNRFNNHHFTGWQRWSDYKHIYQKWSELVDIPSIVILGGEPLLNPTIVEWIQGLNQIFNCEVQVLTNGTRLNHVDGLYDALLFKSKKNNAQNNIEISLHNIDDWNEIRENISHFFKNPFKEYGTLVNQLPIVENEPMYTARDSCGVQVSVHLDNYFIPSAVKKLNESYTLFNSDPVDAHSNCAFAKWKCYHMIKGKLYKCGPVALIPEFDQQFNLSISNTDRVLLNSYTPLSVENFADYNVDFFNTLDLPIPQCKFCPDFASFSLGVKLPPIHKGSDFK
jgi:organic radical activating enzyme